MATKSQIEMVLREFKKIHPPHPVGLLQRIDETQEGVGAVLCLLHESDETVTAGRVSEVLGVSTARVAVLLKKWRQRGLSQKGMTLRMRELQSYRLQSREGRVSGK